MVVFDPQSNTADGKHLHRVVEDRNKRWILYIEYFRSGFLFNNEAPERPPAVTTVVRPPSEPSLRTIILVESRWHHPVTDHVPLLYNRERAPVTGLTGASSKHGRDLMRGCHTWWEAFQKISTLMAADTVEGQWTGSPGPHGDHGSFTRVLFSSSYCQCVLEHFKYCTVLNSSQCHASMCTL